MYSYTFKLSNTQFKGISLLTNSRYTDNVIYLKTVSTSKWSYTHVNITPWNSIYCKKQVYSLVTKRRYTNVFIPQNYIYIEMKVYSCLHYTLKPYLLQKPGIFTGYKKEVYLEFVGNDIPLNCVLDNLKVYEYIGLPPFCNQWIYLVFAVDTVSRCIIRSVYLQSISFAIP